MCLHPKNRSVSFQNRLKMFFRHFQVFTRCRFQNVPVRAPFSKSTVFKICRQKMCRFRVNGRPIHRIFHRFQNVSVSCERSLRLTRYIFLCNDKTGLYEFYYLIASNFDLYHLITYFVTAMSFEFIANITSLKKLLWRQVRFRVSYYTRLREFRGKYAANQ